MTQKQKAQLNSAISTLRDFCISQEHCKYCPFCGNMGCKLTATPNSWELVENAGTR